MRIKVAKNDFTRKKNDFEAFTKLYKNVSNLCEIMVATGFENLPKVH